MPVTALATAYPAATLPAATLAATLFAAPIASFAVAPYAIASLLPPPPFAATVSAAHAAIAPSSSIAASTLTAALAKAYIPASTVTATVPATTAIFAASAVGALTFRASCRPPAAPSASERAAIADHLAGFSGFSRRFWIFFAAPTSHEATFTAPHRTTDPTVVSTSPDSLPLWGWLRRERVQLPHRSRVFRPHWPELRVPGPRLCWNHGYRPSHLRTRLLTQPQWIHSFQHDVLLWLVRWKSKVHLLVRS